MDKGREVGMEGREGVGVEIEGEWEGGKEGREVEGSEGGRRREREERIGIKKGGRKGDRIVL